MSRLRTFIAACCTTALLAALTAPFAFAERSDHGEGLYGETNDKIVTYAGFMIIAFFSLLVFAVSMLQRKLDQRKDAKIAAHEGRDLRFKGGW